MQIEHSRVGNNDGRTRWSGSEVTNTSSSLAVGADASANALGISICGADAELLVRRRVSSVRLWS